VGYVRAEADDTIELSFDNVLADHLAADRLYYRSTLFWKIDKVVAVLILAVGIMSVWFAGPYWWTLIWFPVGVMEWFNLISLRPFQIRYWFKHNPKFRETYHLTLDRNGIHFQTKSIDARLTWGHYTRILENDDLFLLVYGTRMYTVIPKRVFRSATELAKFRSIVHTYVGSGAQG
jgi:hypothetical protein